MTVRIGSIIHSYCNWDSTNDEYGCNRIEAMGYDWVVARAKDGGVAFANVAPEKLEACLEKLKDHQHCDFD